MRSFLIHLPLAFFLLLTLIITIGGNGCAPYHDLDLGSNKPAGMVLSVDPQLNSQGLQILTNRCVGCHGVAGSGNVSDITNVDHLINVSLITPGDPNAGRLIGSITGGTMPQGSSMAAGELTTLQNWISSMTWVPEGMGTPIGLPPPIVLEAKFSNISQNILQPKCVPCHKTGGSEPSLRYETYQLTISTGKIVKGLPLQSAMYIECKNKSMPLAPYSALSAEELKVLYDWIAAGTLNN